MRQHVLLVALALTGCTTFVTVDGYKMVDTVWRNASSSVQQQASFDLKCQDIRLHVLDGECEGLHTGPCRPTKIGVEGCGQKATYTALDLSVPWVASSVTSETGAK